jgi:hypothetical protein
MKPKEKARELIGKFQHPPSAFEHTECDCLHIDIAKECALIAVDEILKSKPCKFDGYYYELNLKYWQEVKQELETL